MNNKTKTTYLLAFITLCLTVIFYGFNNIDTTDGFDLAKREVVLRKIGHEVLLSSGDSTSRVLPVKQIAANEYQIRFEKEFSFQPDTLVSIIKDIMVKSDQPLDYVVNVMNCGGTDIIFSYAILGSEKRDIESCLGRVQLKSCYKINLKFRNKGITPTQKKYLIGGLPLLAFVGLLLFRKTKNIKIEADGAIALGNTFFDTQKRHLTYRETITELTLKESRLLAIFARSPNIIIERSRLQKELWEDEGVIVGRSLDMFISKLRRKLDADPSIQLVNIHGKGYKLEVIAR